MRENTPTVACFLGGGATGGPLRDESTARAVPTVAFPESAADALAHAVRLAEWRRRSAGTVPALTGIDPDRARAIVRDRLAAEPEGAWLDMPSAAALLDAYGIPVSPTRRAASIDEAVSVADELGYPVVLKAGAADLVHKTDVGGVRLGLGRPGRGAASVYRHARRARRGNG